MRAAGWEIASHGLKWIDYQFLDREDEERRQMAGGDPHPYRRHRRTAAGLVQRAATSPNTRPWAVEAGGFLDCVSISTPTSCPIGSLG